jgi:hypothetical protein
LSLNDKNLEKNSSKLNNFSLVVRAKLKTPALTLDIKRIKIGGFGLKDLSS